MSRRRRLRVAERRVVEALIDEATPEVRPLVAQMEMLLVDRIATLPVELRVEALQMALNEWGNELYTGVTAGFLTAQEP